MHKSTTKQPKQAKLAKPLKTKKQPTKTTTRKLATTKRSQQSSLQQQQPSTSRTITLHQSPIQQSIATLTTSPVSTTTITPTTNFQEQLHKQLQQFSKRTFTGGVERRQGTVKWFDAARGFGFITTDTGSDLFVHFTAINTSSFRNLEQGQTVNFSIGATVKGPAAVDVVPVIVPQSNQFKQQKNARFDDV